MNVPVIHNYTGHKFVIKTGDSSTILEPEGEAQVLNERTDTTSRMFWIHGHMTGVAFRNVQERSTVGLPEPRDGHVYIVSWPVARVNLHRQDLVIGDDPVYNKQGRTIAVRVLALLCKGG